MSSLVRLIERIVGGAGIFAAMLLVPLVFATCYEVFSRYVMGEPTAWSYEIGYVLTGSHFLLALAYTLRAGEHIRIDIFSGKFSRRTHAVIDAAAYCVVVPLLIWVAVALLEYMVTGYLRNERSGQSALNMPVWLFRTVYFLSLALFAMQACAELLKSVARIRGEATGG